MGKEYSFQQMVLGQLDIHMQKNKVGILPHIISLPTSQNKLQMDQELQCKG